MKIFILEDNQERIKIFLEKYPKAIVAKTATDAIAILSKQKTWDKIFLDHDLGNEIFVDVNVQNTGSEVARWMSEHPIEGEIIIHSLNPIGVRHMMALLPKAEYIPFYRLQTILKYGDVYI